MLWAVCLTGVILIVEAVGGALSHSLSLLSDAGHMDVQSGARGPLQYGVRLGEVAERLKATPC